MSKERRTAGITEKTGICWGLICLIPFGWIFFLASIIRRKNDVIKYGVLDSKLALDVLHNYIVGFIVVTIIVVIAFFASLGRGGEILIPNVIAIVVITIVYNVVVEKILRFEEDRQSGKTVARNTLKELKEQNRSMASKIEKLEKEIKKKAT